MLLAAVAPIRPLAWEPPHAVGATLKGKRKEGETGDSICNSKKTEVLKNKSDQKINLTKKLTRDLVLLSIENQCYKDFHSP